MNAYISRLRGRIIEQISTEISARKIVVSITLGFTLGVIPFFCGLNILLSFIAAWRFKLNHILIQLISNIVYPLQIILFYPFLKMGVYLFTNDELIFSPSLIYGIFTENAFEGIKLLGIWNLYGLLCWLIFAIPFFYLIYYSTLLLMMRYKMLPARLLITERRKIRQKKISILKLRNKVAY